MQTYIQKKTTIYVPSPRNLLIAAINCVLLMSRSSNLTFLIVPIKLDVPVKNTSRYGSKSTTSQSILK